HRFVFDKENAGMQWNKIIKEMFFLLGIAIISALAVNYFSPAGITLVGKWGESLGGKAAKNKSHVFSGELEIKDVRIAKQIFDSGKAVFVDARSPEDFEKGHIKGAESLPLGQFDDLIGAFGKKYPADTYIVAYCSDKTCDDSHRLEELLFDHGYVNVSIFFDGYQGWKAEGFPIER
ncbi:MAG: rhodanese-like domain-containing protein, partial [Desulfobacterales bacterium]